MAIALLEILRCPVCRGVLSGGGETLSCPVCVAGFTVRDGIPDLLDDRLPGMLAKRREAEGWPELARVEGWYEPDDEVDAHLPFLARDLGWQDRVWRANEHSFSLLLERFVRPGTRVLEIGAAKCWAAQHLLPLGCDYVATDILDDRNIGLGRGEFYERRAGFFHRIRADGEHLPLASGVFDLVYSMATLHHALDLKAMIREMARVTRRGGLVCALNEGTRALGHPADPPDQEHQKGFGINEHVHTLYAYVWAFARSGLAIRRIEQAEGYDNLATRRIAGRLLRLPLVGRNAATIFSQTCHGYSGVSLYARKLL